MTGAYFAKHCKLTSVLCEVKKSVVDGLLSNDEAMDEEVDIRQLIKKEQEASSGFVKSPDVYSLEEYDDVETHFKRYEILCKKHMNEEVQSDSFFRSYRYILEMHNFAESRNTLTFWKDYIKQLYAQLPSNEQTRLWITLQDMFNNPSNMN